MAGRSGNSAGPAQIGPAQIGPAQIGPAQIRPARVTPPSAPTATGPRATFPTRHVAPNSDKVYLVKPPAGRFHESLWEIAQNHLGDGRRYREIFELNSDRVQPDGSKLTIASLIRPGWVLLMPKDAHGQGIQALTPYLADELGIASHASAGGAPAEPGGQGAAPAVELPVVQAPAGPVRDIGIFAAPSAPAQHAPVWPYELSSASLLAAGVLVALGRRRREQLWRRAFGRRIAGPDPGAALAETALRLGADDPAVRMLDTRPAAPVRAARHDRPDPADRVRGAPRPGAPGSVDRPARPEPAAAVAGRRRRPGVAAPVRGHRRTRRAGDRRRERHARPVPRPGLARHQLLRPDPGRPGGGPRPDRGARPAPGGAGGAVRAGRRAGDEPVV